MYNATKAKEDFRRAHNQAALREVFSRVMGRSTDLLSYEEVLKKLQVRGQTQRGLHEIPLSSIIGSVGRYTDFTRDFLPKRPSDEERWARVKLAMNDLVGVPPIEVYQIDEAYFVIDGNHRVSVAREMGAKFIQAYVTEVKTRVPLTPDIQPDELIIKEEYGNFLEATRLDVLCLEADLTVSVPGSYPKLLEHISVHRYFMGIDEDRPIEYEEAVVHWFHKVYLPIIRVVREQRILRDFPGRTETDLYLWIMQYYVEVEEQLGWKVNQTDAAMDFAARFSSHPKRIFRRLRSRLFDLLTPNVLETGPKVGLWREAQAIHSETDNFFLSILVPVHYREESWRAVDQALKIAKKEKSRLMGLHILPEYIDEETDATRNLYSEFNRRCEEEGVQGNLAVAHGEISEQIIQRSYWSDLIIISLAHAPLPRFVERLRSGLRVLIQRLHHPLLTIPGEPSEMQNALLAYDGSPKSKEALYVAAYLAGSWQTKITVLTIGGGHGVTAETQEYARVYLQSHSIEAEYIYETGSRTDNIIRTAEAKRCDLIIAGGYGSNPLVELIAGSTVDRILLRSKVPVLICR
jgi:nucleotide-binding universal stress UspA family protein